MLVSLGCSKFNFWDKKTDASLIFIKNNKLKKINKSFKFKYDTQDFLISKKHIIFCHHNGCRYRDEIGNIEIYPNTTNLFSEIKDKPTLLPNDGDIYYPTCLHLFKNILFVGTAGKNYLSTINVYDISDIKNIQLISTKILNSDKSKNPSSIIYFRNKILVTYFLKNTYEVFELKKDFSIHKAIKNKNSIINSPLSSIIFNDKILIISHYKNSIFSLDKLLIDKDHCFSPIKITGEQLDSPWGICRDNGYIYLANLGINKNQPPFICKISQIKDNIFYSERLITNKEINVGSGFTQLRYFKS